MGMKKPRLFATFLNPSAPLFKHKLLATNHESSSTAGGWRRAGGDFPK
jgi:hypothetical protein